MYRIGKITAPTVIQPLTIGKMLVHGLDHKI